eukprot:1142257-Amphidinium_carterae.1
MIPRSVLLVYDPLQSAIGKCAFKAIQLSPQFMRRHVMICRRKKTHKGIVHNGIFTKRNS